LSEGRGRLAVDDVGQAVGVGLLAAGRAVPVVPLAAVGGACRERTRMASKLVAEFWVKPSIGTNMQKRSMKPVLLCA
jgi:hypothetical protein